MVDHASLLKQDGTLAGRLFRDACQEAVCASAKPCVASRHGVVPARDLKLADYPSEDPAMVKIVNEPIDPNRRGDYVFTPERANLMLPLVRRIARDVLDLKREIDGQADQVRGIDRLSTMVDQDRPEFVEELRDVRESLSANQRRMKELLSELGELGICTHESIDGFFDFPAIVGRREVYLCWHPDEPGVTHWHDVLSERRMPIDGTDFEASSN